jgi:hypothetical protein
MKAYTLATAIWLHGVEIPAGSTVNLSKNSAKYYQHAFEKPKAEVVVEAPVEVTPEEIPAADDDKADIKPRRKLKAPFDADQN